MAPSDPLQEVTAALAGFLVANAPLGETLERVAELAVTAVGSADACGLTLIDGRRRPVTVFASNAELSREVDKAQYRDGDGPCLEAYRRRTVVRVGDAASAADRWPAYAAAAAEVGVGSSLSLPLTAAQETYGALNLYARAAGAFSDADVSRAEVFAAHASVVLSNASAYWDAQDLAAGLSEAMKSRAVIEMAKGKLMASSRCTPEQAFDMLVSASQRTNVRIRDIAYRIVYDSEPPSADGRSSSSEL